MRKTLTKEVTKTVVKVAEMVIENGTPVARWLDDQILLGNVNAEKAQKEMNKRFDHPVTVFGVEADTTVYEMSVEDFITVASVKSDEEPEAAESQE